MIMIGDMAKVVKKAVAADRISGSFLPSSTKDGFMREKILPGFFDIYSDPVRTEHQSAQLTKIISP